MCAPAAPNYTQAAQAQGQANVDATRQAGISNNPNIQGPSGGQTVTFDQSGHPTITQNLSPNEQNIFNLNQQARTGLGNVSNQGVNNVFGVMGQPFNFANYLQSGSLGGSSGSPPPYTPDPPPVAPPNVPFTPGGQQQPQPQPSPFPTGGGIRNHFPSAFSAQQGSLPSDSGFQTRVPMSGEVQGSLPTGGFMGGQPGYQGGTLADPSQRRYAGGSSTFQEGSGMQTPSGPPSYGMGASQVSQPQGSPTGVPQQSIDTSNVAQMPVNPGQTGQQALMSRLQPQIDQMHQQFQTQMANQGVSPGSEAYNNASRMQSQQENDMLQQAALQGINLDFQANNQGFNQAQAQGQFGNTAQAQALQQGLQQRELPLNEVTALMSGGQVSMPQFQGYQGQPIQPSPIMQGATNQGNYNAGIYNSQAGALGGLAGMGLYGAMMSDRRLKRNIQRIGTYRELPVYEYDIFDRHEIGVMADEVEKIKPEAVSTHWTGFKMVNYGLLDS